MDLRLIPINKYPQPPEGFEWEITENVVSLNFKEEQEEFKAYTDYVSYCLPGGEITSHADKEVVFFFCDAIRKLINDNS
jgi:hypothetical protein